MLKAIKDPFLRKIGTLNLSPNSGRLYQPYGREPVFVLEYTLLLMSGYKYIYRIRGICMLITNTPSVHNHMNASMHTC